MQRGKQIKWQPAEEHDKEIVLFLLRADKESEKDRS